MCRIRTTPSATWDNAIRGAKVGAQVKRKYIDQGVIVDDGGDNAWGGFYEAGSYAHLEEICLYADRSGPRRPGPRVHRRDEPRLYRASLRRQPERRRSPRARDLLPFTGFDLSSALRSVPFFLLLAAGLMYIPAVVVFVAMSGELMSALNPVLAVSFLAHLKWDYLILLVGTVSFVVAEWIAIALLPGPLRYANTLVEAYAVLVTMALYGNVLRRRSRELGL